MGLAFILSVNHILHYKKEERFILNKLFIQLFTVISVIALLFGCSTNDIQDTAPNNSESKTSEKTSDVQEEVVITISKNEGAEIITEKEVSIEEGAILMDVMKENFEIEEGGGLITSIDGVSQDVEEKMGWMYFVNDEMAMVGAEEYELSVGDKVTFDLQSWE